KKPDAKVSQALSDLSEMALELKKMIDHHVLLGVSSPKSFGLVVAANQWEKYLARIEELCASKWLKQCKRTSEGLLMSQTRECHRHGHSTPFRSSRISSKDSKKVGFKAALSILQFKNDSLVVQIKVPIGHGFHVPREEGDFRTLPLTTETVQVIERNLKNGTNRIGIKAAVLRRIERWGNGIR
ncbi:hypothetical protein CU098_001463, partial [Rhizopus stolonifer]